MAWKGLWRLCIHGRSIDSEPTKVMQNGFDEYPLLDVKEMKLVKKMPQVLFDVMRNYKVVNDMFVFGTSSP